MAVKVESAPVEPQDTPMRNLDDSNGPAEVFEDPSSQAQARKGVAVLDDVVAPKTGRAGEFSHVRAQTTELLFVTQMGRRKAVTRQMLAR